MSLLALTRRGLRQQSHGSMVCLAHRRNIIVPGGLLTFVTPQRENTCGTLLPWLTC